MTGDVVGWGRELPTTTTTTTGGGGAHGEDLCGLFVICGQLLYTVVRSTIHNADGR